MIDEFAQKYPETENTHDVKLSEAELETYLKTLERHYNTLNDEGFKVPRVTYHGEGPYITFERPEDRVPLSEHKDLNDNQKKNVLARAHEHAKRIMQKYNIVIYNRSDKNIFYDAKTNEVWLYDLRQTTWDDVKRYYFKVQRKPRQQA